MSARSIAFRVLLQELRAQAYLNLALDAALRSAGTLPRQETALATELVYGIARRQMALDAALAPHSSRPLDSLEAGVRVALRMGAYQLLYLSRIPPHAAVGETVAVLKQEGLERAAGFANAVLRRVSESMTVPLPEEPVARLSIAESHPRWLVERWIRRFGLEEARALCEANNQAPRVTVRVNRNRATREEVIAALAAEEVTALPTPQSPLGLSLQFPGAMARLESFRKGLFQVQDESAQRTGLLLDAQPGERILDACAAPGGKSCLIAEALGETGKVIALDLYPRKLAKLSEEAKRLGLSRIIEAQVADSSQPLRYPRAIFDRILLDAPCSGLGTLRRHPELRYRRTESEIGELAEMQRAFVRNLLPYLKPGGIFVFAVCSSEPEEGEEQLAWLEKQGLTLAPDRSSAVLETFPHRDGADGFFAARFVRG